MIEEDNNKKVDTCSFLLDRAKELTPKVPIFLTWELLLSDTRHKRYACRCCCQLKYIGGHKFCKKSNILYSKTNCEEQGLKLTNS